MPWITLVLAALICVSPLGQEVYRGLHSGEQLARSMARIVLIVYGPIALLVALLETGIRIFILRRRNNRAKPVAPAETES